MGHVHIKSNTHFHLSPYYYASVIENERWQVFLVVFSHFCEEERVFLPWPSAHPRHQGLPFSEPHSPNNYLIGPMFRKTGY